MSRRQFLVLAGVCSILTVGAVVWAAHRSDDPGRVVDAYLAAWNRHDVEGAAASLAPDVVYFDASVGVSLKGRDAVKAQVIQNYMSAVLDSKWEIIGTPLVEGRTVFFQWRFSGTNTGAWANGTPATGAPFSFEGRSSAEVVDGLIVNEVDYYDPAGIFGAAR